MLEPVAIDNAGACVLMLARAGECLSSVQVVVLFLLMHSGIAMGSIITFTL